MANEPRDAITREIDEELRREQLLKLWDKYGTYALAAAVVLVVGVGIWRYYEYQQQQAREAASTQYIVALGDFASKRGFEGQKRLEELVPKAPPGYAALARLRLAAYDSGENNAIDALNTYDRIVKDESVDPILRDFARLQIAMLKFDSADFPEIRNQLSPLANDRSPWRYSARELLGMGAIKAGFADEARSHFQRLIGDRTTPAGIAERARMMVAMLDENRAKSTAKAEPGANTPPAKVEEKAKATPDKASK